MHINRGKPVSSRVINWILELKDYDYTVVYVPEAKIKHADALSRIRWDNTEVPGVLDHPSERIEPPVGEMFMLMGEDEDPTEYEPVLDFSQWAEAQRDDPSLHQLLQRAKDTSDSLYAIKDGIAYQHVEPTDQYLPLAPSAFRQQLLKAFHGSPMHGHRGPERTFQSMVRHVTWPSMRRDVFEYVKRCDICQKHKRSYLRVPMQTQYIPPEPFHTVSMDIVGPVPKSTYGEEYILVIQDMLTRWVEFAALKQTDTQSILTAFLKCWVTRYGAPRRVLTDRGTNFVSNMALAFYRFFGINKIHTTAYRPQGNGANERMHQELTKYLSMFLQGQSTSRWVFLLNEARWAYNTAYNQALRRSPYEALFASLPPLGPLGIPQPEANHESFEKYFGRRRQDIVATRKHIQTVLAQAQEAARARFNAHSHAIPFRVGDWVLYKNHNPRHKWDQKYLGPWKIVDQINPVVFEIDIRGQRFSAHAAHLKPYEGDTENLNTQSDSQISSGPSMPPITEIEEEDSGNYIASGTDGATPDDPSDGNDLDLPPAHDSLPEETERGETRRLLRFPPRPRPLSFLQRFRPRQPTAQRNANLVIPSPSRPRRQTRAPSRLGDWTV
jgi:transposase InsO family protein